MTLPLEIQILFALRRAVRSLNPDSRCAIERYVRSQMSGAAFVNRGGRADLYYTMFGWLLCHVLGINTRRSERAAFLRTVTAPDALHRHALAFCRQLHSLLSFGAAIPVFRLKSFMRLYASHTVGRTLNGAAARLLSEGRDAESLDYIVSLQDSTGGFYSSASSPMPDLLSTAVGLFTLRSLGVPAPFPARPFIEVHFADNGSFMPNLADSDSDAEYTFYALLALGSC